MKLNYLSLLLLASPLMMKAQNIKLITLDPGHFHAALIQKSMYPQVDPSVHVYAEDGRDLKLHPVVYHQRTRRALSAHCLKHICKNDAR